MPSVDPESRKGRQMMNDFAGVDVEKQVNRVVAYVAAVYAARPANAGHNPKCHGQLVLVQGTFDPSRIEAFIRERAGTMDEYKGRKIFVRHRGRPRHGGRLRRQSDLIAMGQGDLVRARDRSYRRARRAARKTSPPIAEMMTLIRDNAGSTAWVVGQFYEISRRMRLPSSVAGQVPPVRLVAVKANINGGVKVCDSRRGRRHGCGRSTARRRARGSSLWGGCRRGGSRSSRTLLKSIELSGRARLCGSHLRCRPTPLRVLRRLAAAAVAAGAPGRAPNLGTGTESRATRRTHTYRRREPKPHECDL